MRLPLRSNGYYYGETETSGIRRIKRKHHTTLLATILGVIGALGGGGGWWGYSAMNETKEKAEYDITQKTKLHEKHLDKIDAAIDRLTLVQSNMAVDLAVIKDRVVNRRER